MNYAIIDIGSNTVKVHFYRVGNGSFERFGSVTRPIKLISYIKNGIMSQDGITLLCNTLSEFRYEAARRDCEIVAAFATASLRRAKNGQEIAVRAARRTGITIELIDGESEARLSLAGVRSEIGDDCSGILLDMGGGSTEIIVFDAEQITYLDSIPFGSLSLYREYVSGTLPDGDERARIKAYVLCELEKRTVQDTQTLYVAGGTGRAVCKIHAHFTGGNAKGLYRMSTQQFDELYDSLIADPQVESLFEELISDRKTTFLPGATAIRTIAHATGATQLVFPSVGVREGYLLSIL